MIDWEKEFDSKFNIAYVHDKGWAFLGEEIKSFISSLLAEQRSHLKEECEKQYGLGQREGIEYARAQFRAMMKEYAIRCECDACISDLINKKKENKIIHLSNLLKKLEEKV